MWLAFSGLDKLGSIEDDSELMLKGRQGGKVACKGSQGTDSHRGLS